MRPPQIQEAIRQGANNVGSEIAQILFPPPPEGEERHRVFYKRSHDHSESLMIKSTQRTTPDSITRSMAAKIRKQEQIQPELQHVG